MTRGLELLASRAVAVIVDERGQVEGRQEAGSSPDLGDAALAALDALGGSSSLLAIASVDPESPASIAAVSMLADRLGDRLARVSAIPSGTAAAIAECWVGAAPGAANAVFLAAAEQTSAGILRDGQPTTGVHGRAPAVAWLALNPVEREDYRKLGCLEAEVGAPGIVRRLVWRIKSGDESGVEKTAGGLGGISLEHVLQAARGGDGVAISVVRDTARYLGMAATNLVAMTDPDVLILGGIMASAADLLFESVRAELTRRLPASMIETLTVVAATLGPVAPAIGAARLAAVHAS